MSFSLSRPPVNITCYWQGMSKGTNIPEKWPALDLRPDLEEHHSKQSHMYHDQADLHQKIDQSMRVFRHM